MMIVKPLSSGVSHLAHVRMHMYVGITLHYYVYVQ